MDVSVVIPVWNGAGVISDCLAALFAHDDGLCQVVCVDNYSRDESASLIARDFPQVKLVPQRVNLGFAGGVNAGIEAAQGDIFVLLNQDCWVHPGWLDALREALVIHPDMGIAGGIIFNPDGSINHTGAYIRQPDGYGVHQTTAPNGAQPHPVPYVTGALFALRRQTWEQVGSFDEGFYPAYFEEADYCFRARRLGWTVCQVPGVAATHHFSNREWQVDPIKHEANQHFARYRFVAKQFDSEQLNAFLEAEDAAILAEAYRVQLIGRLLAARDLLRQLPEVVASRKRDLDLDTTLAHQRQLHVGFTAIRRIVWEAIREFHDAQTLSITQLRQKLKQLQDQEYELLARIYFRHPQRQTPESQWRRLWRLLVLRPLSFLTLRDYLLQAQLNTLHVARIDLISHLEALRLDLLEHLDDYDYR